MTNELKVALYKEKRVFETALKCDEKTANKYILGVYNTIVNNTNLQKCTVESIKDAAVTSATLGLPVDARGLAYLIPYAEKVQFQISYKGYIYLAKQDPDVDNVVTGLVYPDDEFSVDMGANTITHIPDLSSSRYGLEGQIRYAYAIVRFKANSGRSQVFEVMSKTQVNDIRKESKAGGETDKYGKPTIWQKHFGEMARKTVIKRLCKHAQLGDIAIYDLVDNAVHENKIINVTPEGELLVDNPDEVFKIEYIEKLKSCNTLEEFEATQLANQDKIQELMLYNVKVSKEINTALTPIQDNLYISKLEEALDNCEDIDSIEQVFNSHEKRINAMRVANKKHLLEYYASCRTLLCKNLTNKG